MAKKSKAKANHKNIRKEKVQKEKEYIASLEEKIKELDVSKADEVSQFKELPISEGTLKGLSEAGYISMTDIQKKTIGLALKGEDILGAARTGSGKTLAFLIPLIESLYRKMWNEFDGLGALVISPTRELAMQIYEVLVKIGKHNNFSAGLIIGGKDVKFEKQRITKMNILIGTPGRILQHMDQTAGLDLSNLQMLVLDEADRILDMGFKKTIDSIIENLSPDRQTLLFSATQTKSVSDLARLSLANPQYVDTEANLGLKQTPQSLEESYITVELQDKLDTLWSFLKTHLKSKIIVFFSCSKQVHYVYETFRKMQPGISLLKLHGRQKQTSRMETTYKFTKASQVCLLATDVVARGLDFPSVDWVVQIDCPEDTATYVHRVGRAARFGKTGKSLLFLTPSEEEPFLKRLEAKKIAPRKLNIKQAKKKSIQSKLQALCFSDPEIKYLGQKAFISYFRSVYLQQDKEVFDINKLPSEEYAKSLGLPGAPKIKIKGGSKSKELKNASRQLLGLSKANEDGEIEDKKKEVKTKYDRMFERQNQGVLSEHYMNVTKKTVGGDADNDDDDEDDFMAVKRQDHALKEEDLPDLSIPVSKRQLRKATSKKASLANHGNPTKMKFDDEGVAHPIYELEDEEDFHRKGDAASQIKEYVDKETKIMAEMDEHDKEVAREKRQEKKRRRRELERLAEESGSDDDDEEQVTYVVGTGDIDEDLKVNAEYASSGDERGANKFDSGSDSDSDSDSEPAAKKPKWFDNDKVNGKNRNEGDDGVNVIEYAEPETLEDLEALSAKLLQN